MDLLEEELAGEQLRQLMATEAAGTSFMRQQVQEKREILSDLQSQLSKYKFQLNVLQKDIEALELEKKEKRLHGEQLRAQSERMDTQLKQQNAQIAGLKHRLKQIQLRTAKQRKVREQFQQVMQQVRRQAEAEDPILKNLVTETTVKLSRAVAIVRREVNQHPGL